RRRPAHAPSATGASESLDQPGLRKCAERLLEETEWDALGRRDLACRHENPIFTAQGELDHRPHGVLKLLGDPKGHGKWPPTWTNVGSDPRTVNARLPPYPPARDSSSSGPP